MFVGEPRRCKEYADADSDGNLHLGEFIELIRQMRPLTPAAELWKCSTRCISCTPLLRLLIISSSNSSSSAAHSVLEFCFKISNDLASNS